MADSATIQILLNAGGNLGTVVDAASGKILALGKSARGAGDVVKRETQQAQQGVAVFGEQAAKAFGSSSSALAKFAGPLGALGGISAVAGATMAKALDLAKEKFVALIEEPVRLAEALRDATKAANDLAKAREAVIAGNVTKLGGVAEPLVAQGGERALALARQISTDTGVELADVSKVVRAGGQAGLGDDSIRRVVEAAKLVRQSGRMSFEDATKAGIANRADAGLSAPEVAADMVNREAFAAHQSSVIVQRQRELASHNQAQEAAREEFDRQRQEAYSQAQLQWNLDGQTGERPTMGPEFQPARFKSSLRFRPSVTAEDFAGMQANLAASPVVQAVEAKRAADAARADLALDDVGNSGAAAISTEAANARVDRMYPGLRKFMEEDRKLQADEEVAQKAEEAWSWNPWSTTSNDRVRISKERSRKASAFRLAGGFNPQEDYESPDAFLARGDAERAKLEAQGKALGVPFGAGTSAIETLLERIAQNTAGAAPAPLQEAQ